MTFKRTLGIIAVAGASLISSSASLDTLLFADEQQKREQQKDNTPLITDKEIEELMQRGSVEEILKEEADAGFVKYVAYDVKKGRTNYEELVFQTQIEPENRRPVLTLFYSNTPTEGTGFGFRSAIIFKVLSKQYANKVRFICYEEEVESGFSFNNVSEYKKFVARFEVTELPSFALYSPFDVVKGETSTNNDGKIKKIDVLRGGPVDTAWLLVGIKNINEYWIPTNITAPNGLYAWRVNNSADYKKVEVISQIKK